MGNEKKEKKKERKWSCSVMSDSTTPWTTAHQAPQSVEFSRQEHWSGLPSPSSGDLSTQGSNPGLPHCRQTLLPSEGDEDHLKSAWVGKVSLLQWSKSRLASRLHRYPTLILNELCNLYLSFPWCIVKLNNSYSINILKWFNWCRLVSFLFDSVYDIQRCPI